MPPLQYEIHKDGRFFARFEHGTPTRFNKPMNWEIAQQELQSCIAVHEGIINRRKGEGGGLQHTWELRLIRPKGSPIYTP